GRRPGRRAGGTADRVGEGGTRRSGRAARADPTDSHHPEQRRQTVFKWAHCVITGVMEARSVFCTERNKSGFDVRLCDNRKLRCAHGRSNGERVAECGEAVIPGWEFVIQLMRSSR